ncbi:MAG: acyltransferase [Halioglobus sp.]
MVNSRHLDFIDGLRGLAIFGVIYHHLFWHKTSPGFGALSIGGAELHPFTLLSNGWMGVNLFFFLSGFVLYYPYISSKRTLQNTVDLKDFYYRRAKRLLPLFYFNVFVSAFLIPQAPGAEDFYEKLLLVCTFTNIFTLEYYITPFNFVLWSLALELWFSLLFPLVVFLFNRFGYKIVVSAVVIISLGTRIYGLDESFQLRGTDYLNPVRDSIFGRLDDFVLGMLCCYVCVSNRVKFITTYNAYLFTLTGFILGLAACLLWDSVVLERSSLGTVPYINIVLNIAFFLVVVSLYRSNNLLNRLCENWPIMLLGMMCYSLYVWHGVILMSIMRLGMKDFGLPAFFLALLVIGTLSYRYIEFGHIRDSKRLFRL